MRCSKICVVGAIVGSMVIASSWVAPRSVSAQGGAAAQQAPAPVRLRVQVTEVKPDMVQRWQDLTRTEAIPAQKKAGLAWRHTFAAGGPFGPGSTFVTVQPVTNYAQFDQGSAITRGLGADGAAKLNAKLQPTIVRTHARILTLQANDSIESRSTTPPALVVVQTIQLLPGKGAEYGNLWRSDYLPHYRKAGVRDIWVFTANYGAPLGQIVTVRPISTYAELDQQPGLLQRGGLSAEAAQKINARRSALISGSEIEVHRFIPELSFGTTARATN
jgi:hypothetical protein